MSKVTILSGSNLDDRSFYIQQAIKLIKERVGVVTAQSSVYESEPWGYTSSNSFYNQLIVVETKFNPQDVLCQLQKIEYQLGRVRDRGGKYIDRTLDLDILFYDDLVMNSERLVIPHPEVANRRFVLAPLAELFPEKTHPVLRKTFAQLLEFCPDKGNVFKL